ARMPRHLDDESVCENDGHERRIWTYLGAIYRGRVTIYTDEELREACTPHKVQPHADERINQRSDVGGIQSHDR
ncbi:unnamed protein product, partial [Fusarium graminearum]